MSFFGGFLAPAMALGFLSLPVVVLLYFLKLKRDEHVISSTLLWQKSFEEMRVNSPFQRLRRNLLLFLQLIILALGVLALMRPVTSVSATEGRRLIVLIDTSASMKTDDVGGKSRVEAAKDKARELAGGLSRGEEMAVIAFDRTPRVLSPFTPARSDLDRAIDTIKASDLTTDLARAIAIADGMARSGGSGKDTVIVILSDGRFGAMEDFLRFGGGEAIRRAEAKEFAGEAAIRFVSIGAEKSDNTAITALEARRELSGRQGIEVFCRIANYSDQPVTAPLELRLDGRLLDAKELTIQADSESSTVFESLAWKEGVLEVNYRAADSLPVDNVARAVMSELKEARALLVTSGNFFLEKALANVPDVSVETVSPAVFASMEASEPEKLALYDCIICDSTEPKIVREGNFLIFNGYPAVQGLVVTDEVVDQPEIIIWDQAHPTTRFANFAPVIIRKAPVVQWPKRTVAVVESSSGTIIGAVTEERLNAVIVAFDMYESNWPLRRSFPIFVANTVRWLAGGSPRRASANLRTGGVITVFPSGRAGKLVLTDPRGRDYRVAVASDKPSYFTRTQLVGIYKGKLAGKDYKWAVNLLSGEESDNRAAKSFELGAEGTVESTDLDRNRESWKILVLIAFAILCLEWWIYNRRMYF